MRNFCMNEASIVDLSRQWQWICDDFSNTDLTYALQFIQDNSFVLVSEFYKKMMEEKTASEFLSDEIVQSRLKSSLNNWLLESFEVPFQKNFYEMVQKQLKVGEVHARIGIPSWLIIRGIRQIEKKVFCLLNKPQQNLLSIASYIVQVLGFTSEIMSRTYEAKAEINNDMKHTYRLFSAMQDVAVQKDKQRGSLLDWENELMFKVFSDQTNFTHTSLSKSEFGLWFIHKAAYAFSSSDQVKEIISGIKKVDVLNQKIMSCADKTLAIQLIQEIRNQDREILLLVDQLFQVSEYIGSGNDSLTQLLNRRYLNTIVSRETLYARKHKTHLSLLAIDVDHFKRINDQYGHATGDIALQLLAEVILEHTRGSDYAFRVGGEEFLLLQVATDLNMAEQIAEKIRQRIQTSEILSSTGVAVQFTVSIGVVSYDGHPDYQRFLESADTALYAAKNNGRNLVYIA